MIKRFEGKFRFLSNFYLSEVEYNGLVFTNAEAAFHSQKDCSRAKDFQSLNPSQAKSLGRRVKLRSDWPTVKDNIMLEIVRNKFKNPRLLKQLLDTQQEELVEGNTWHDNYWGTCYCEKCNNKGLNKLGKIIMQVRKEQEGESFESGK